MKKSIFSALRGQKGTKILKGIEISGKKIMSALCYLHIQNAPKSVSRGIFFRNFRFSALENCKSSFWVCKSPKADMIIFPEISIFFTILVPFWPLRAEKIDFFINPQNDPKCVSRGILRRNLRFSCPKNQQKSFGRAKWPLTRLTKKLCPSKFLDFGGKKNFFSRFFFFLFWYRFFRGSYSPGLAGSSNIYEEPLKGFLFCRYN